MEMASLRPACSSDSGHRAHPLADRRHVALRRPGRRRAFGLDGWRGQIHRPRAGELSAGCLGQGPDRARRQQAVARGAIACRERSKSLPRPRRSFARPHHHRCAAAAEAAHHLAPHRDGNGGAGQRPDPVHHAARRRASARAACAQRQDHASRRAWRHHQGDLRASRRRQGNRRRLRLRLLQLQGYDGALLAGKRIGHRHGRRGESSGCSHPHLKALPREAERHSVKHRRLHHQRRHAG